MKKLLSLVVVSAMLGGIPLLASAQMGQAGTETTTTTTKNTASPEHSKSTTKMHTTKEMTTEPKNQPLVTTTKKETTHKSTGPQTVKKHTKKATHTVKAGHSAIREAAGEKSCVMKKHPSKHPRKTSQTHKKTGKSAVMQAKPSVTTSTGQSQVRQTPTTEQTTITKKSPVQKVEQGFKNTGSKIHQDWNKMVHPNKNPNTSNTNTNR